MCQNQTREVCQINIFYICTQILISLSLHAGNCGNEMGRDNILKHF